MEKISYNLVFNRKKNLNKRGMALIQVEAYLNKKKMYFSTKIYIKPNQWDDKRKMVKNHPNGNHSIFRHDNFIGCFSADKIKMSARKYFCFNISVYKNMAEEPSCHSPYHEEYIQTSALCNLEGLCRSTYSFLSERR